MQITPYIIALENIIDEPVGGKALGLSRLIKHQLRVPSGFVIVNASLNQLPHDIKQAYQRIGASNVAVRSSALGEDAADISFAGQYDTILNVKGMEALNIAINDCIASLETDRALSYQQEWQTDKTTMNVVVQQMVDAQFAGVVFTADPVSGRHDHLVIDVVEGLGESLVSGTANSDHYVLDNNNNMVDEVCVGSEKLLSHAYIQQLANEARNAAILLGEPLDLEWAIDKDGILYWLQARPITTIGLDLQYLNSAVKPDHVLTRCNIGEIFPGPSCPLTYSMQGKSLDSSLQYMQARFIGLDEANSSIVSQVAYVGGHMFINLTASLDASCYTLLSRAETTAQSICGRTIPELKEPLQKKPLWRRIFGIKDFIVYVREAEKVTSDFAMKMKALSIHYHHDSQSMFNELEHKRHWLTDVTKVHMQSSAMSGALEGVVQSIISKGAISPSLDDQAKAAKLFAGASSVESALLVEQLDVVVDLIAEHSQAKAAFHDVNAALALAWLLSNEAGAAQKAFLSFLENHGHRSYRELCFMEKAWIDEPVKLIASLQAALMARFYPNKAMAIEPVINIKNQPLLIRYLLPRVHNAIRRREYTKSMMVKVTHTLKRAYRYLGELLVQEGKLADANLVFFFLHEELGAFISGQQPELSEIVKLRRRSYEFQQQLVYPDIVVGMPQSIKKVKTELQDGQLRGRPVSKGVVEGIVRIAMNVADAAQLQPGEILVAPVTDVGWTPYFSLIAGLITEVGSAVSHGAVIAREYGLPCIVSAQGATSALKTGDRVRLDADTGIITQL